MSRYGLEQAFNGFLERAASEAASAAVESVNAEIQREKPMATRNSTAIESFKFNLDGVGLEYKADFSEIWDSGARGFWCNNIKEHCERKLIGFVLGARYDFLEQPQYPFQVPAL